MLYGRNKINDPREIHYASDCPLHLIVFKIHLSTCNRLFNCISSLASHEDLQRKYEEVVLLVDALESERSQLLKVIDASSTPVLGERGTNGRPNSHAAAKQVTGQIYVSSRLVSSLFSYNLLLSLVTTSLLLHGYDTDQSG